MSVGKRFSRLDEVVVPRLGSRLHRALISRASRALGLGLLSALALTVIVALWWDAGIGDHATQRAADAGGGIAGSGMLIGPPPGTTSQAYVEHVRREMNELLSIEGATGEVEDVWAVVSLESFATPQELADLFGPTVETQRAFLRPPPADIEVTGVEIEVGEMPGGLSKAMELLADRRESQARDLFELSESLTGDSSAEAEQRDRYLNDSMVAATQAHAYRQGCECVYGAVVRATPGTLYWLQEQPQVRLIHPAPIGVDADSVTFVPLLPTYEPTTSTPSASLDEGTPD
ncbi:hypothetical protein [Natronoglycomyces albus]|uniref:Uncharacterized protein n=1 Tax=Natronoglycomyces albus TaxID=2811108 RepID=A0A895XP16_9ACTN|nr:hypothetical protein [Natronoglycomyces albus]QSB04246.1 hypothetical protein JQS30_10565 [Natronoglycomyces albus]